MTTRTEIEVTWDHLRDRDFFRWEVDGELWVCEGAAGDDGFTARPWRPGEWPEENRRAPARYLPRASRAVWRVTEGD